KYPMISRNGTLCSRARRMQSSYSGVTIVCPARWPHLAFTGPHGVFTVVASRLRMLRSHRCLRIPKVPVSRKSTSSSLATLSTAALHCPGAGDRGAGGNATRRQPIRGDGRHHDVGDAVERPDLVEMDFFDGDAMHACLGLGEPAEDSQCQIKLARRQCPGRE